MDDDRLGANPLSRAIPLRAPLKAYMLSLMVRLVVDTNVFVAALRSEGGASRQVLRRTLEGRYTPLFGNALWSEYEDILGRPLWTPTTTDEERRALLAALAQRGQWVSVYYGWRPNLRDEGDNHLIELAIAGSATAIITHNIGDLRGGEMVFPDLRIMTPSECLEVFP